MPDCPLLAELQSSNVWSCFFTSLQIIILTDWLWIPKVGREGVKKLWKSLTVTTVTTVFLTLKCMKFIIAHVINIFIIFVTEWSISLRTRKLHLLQAGCLCFWTGVKIWRVSVFWGFFSLFSFWFTAHDNYRFFFASCQCLRSQCLMNFFRWFFESSVNHLVSQNRWHWFRTARNSRSIDFLNWLHSWTCRCHIVLRSSSLVVHSTYTVQFWHALCAVAWYWPVTTQTLMTVVSSRCKDYEKEAIIVGSWQQVGGIEMVK